MKHYLKLIIVIFFFFTKGIQAHEYPEASIHPNTGFIANAGQWKNPSRFLITMSGAQIFAEKHAIQYFFENLEDVDKYFNHSLNPHLFNKQTIRQHAVRVDFLNPSVHTQVFGENKLPHYLNFFKGNDPQYWKSRVPVYASIFYQNLYDGINMKMYPSENNGIKYDLILNPHTNHNAIAIRYSGADDIFLQEGNLIIQTSVNKFIEQKPYAYQVINGTKVEVKCAFKLDNNTITFLLGNYNKEVELIIDPLLVFSTYSGSSVDNFGHTATYDNNGNLYAAGTARNPTPFSLGSYPVTVGAFQTVWGGGGSGSESWPLQDFPTDISISKYNHTGTQLLYATYLGGNKNEYPISLVVDNHGQLIVLGATLSANFPVKTGAFQTTKSDTFDIIVTRFTEDGSALVGSTFFGGSGIDGINIADSLRMNYSDEFRGEVQVASNGDVWLVSSTSSNNIATTPGAIQSSKSGVQDGIICRFDSALTQLKACSYLGKERQDALYSLDIFPNGDIAVAGGTQSSTFVPTNGAFSANYHGGISDGFVAKLNGTLSSLIGMRYWGGIDYDQAHFVKLDPSGNIVLMGQTYDSVYATPNVYRNSEGTIFITKFSSNLSNVIFSTQIGKGGKRNALAPSAFMVDICGNIYGSVWGGAINFYSRYRALNASGFTSTTSSLTTTPDAFIKTSDGADFYLFSLSATADSLKYATFFGENNGSDHVDGGTSRFDKRGIIYQSVCASCAFGTSGTFPTTANSYSRYNKSPRCSNASFKFDFRQYDIISASFIISPEKVCGAGKVTFTNTSTPSQKSYWYVNNVLKDSSWNYTDSFYMHGTYNVKLKLVDPQRCNYTDSFSSSFTLYPANKASFTVVHDSCGPLVSFFGNATTENGTPTDFIWHFGLGDTSSETLTPTYIYPSNNTYYVSLIANPNNICADTATKAINYNSQGKQVVADFLPLDSQRCEPTQFQFRATATNGKIFKWYINDTLVSESSIGFDTIIEKGIYHTKLIVHDSTTCNQSDTMERPYFVFKELYPTFTSEIDSCGFTVKFTNTTPNSYNDSVPYFWDFGDSTFGFDKSPIHNYSDSGWYNVTLTANKNLSCQVSKTEQIRLDLRNTVLIAKANLITNPICAPTSITIENNSINAHKWYWLVNNNIKDSVNYNFTDSINTTQPYDLKLIVYNETACKKMDTLAIPINIFEKTKAAFEVERSKCSPYINIKNTTENTTLATTYLWLFSDSTNSTDKEPSVSFSKDTLITITLITNSGTPCADTATQTINYKANAHVLNVEMQISDSILCIPKAISANAVTTNGEKFQWYWNNNLVDTSTNFIDTIYTAGTYTLQLIVIDTNTCIGADTITKTIIANDFTDASFVLQRDSCSMDVTLINTSKNLTVKRFWDLGDGQTDSSNTVKHQYPKTDYYKIKLITSPGTFCADTAEQIHFIDGDTSKEVFIPNVFTPNNDGINDCYKINGINVKCDEFEIIIYNRWGNPVFESKDGNTCWNGTTQDGSAADEGTYYYVVKIKKKNGYKKYDRGTITLIRNSN